MNSGWMASELRQPAEVALRDAPVVDPQVGVVVDQHEPDRVSYLPCHALTQDRREPRARPDCGHDLVL